MSKELAIAVAVLVILAFTVALIPSAGYCGPVPDGCDSPNKDPKHDPKETPDATPGGSYDPR